MSLYNSFSFRRVLKTASAESSYQIEKLHKNSAQLLTQVGRVHQTYSTPSSVTIFLKIVLNMHTHSQNLQKEACVCMCACAVLRFRCSSQTIAINNFLWRLISPPDLQIKCDNGLPNTNNLWITGKVGYINIFLKAIQKSVHFQNILHKGLD